MSRWSLFIVVQYVLTALLLAVLLGSYCPPPSVPMPDVEARFDGQRAYDLVWELAVGFPNRVTGSPEDEAAAAWVAEQLRALGLEVVEQRFEVWGALDPIEAGARAFQGINVLAIHPGQTERAIVIGAHRDIVPETVQGAVDNGSGIGTMIELARVLTASPQRYTYVFAAWGAEEIGLGGSRYYVGHPLRPTALALSVDVTGLVQRTELNLIDWGSLPLAPALAVERMALDQGLISSPRRRDLFDLIGLPLFSGAATDSTPFALQGIPALGIGWDTPHFEIIHTRRDTIEQVDAKSLELAGRLAERLVRLAQQTEAPFLDRSPHYLRREDGWIVPESQVALALAVLVAFTYASPLLAAARARSHGVAVLAELRALAPFLGVCAALAAAVAALPWLLGLWQGPGGPRLLQWVGLAALTLVPVGVAARRLPPASFHARVVANGGLIAVVYTALTTFANPFLMALLLVYPLLVLPRLSFRRGWWRGLDAVLMLPWIIGALGLLFLAQTYGSFLPEYAPAARVTLFEGLVALLLYAVVGLALMPRIQET